MSTSDAGVDGNGEAGVDRCASYGASRRGFCLAQAGQDGLGS